MSTFQVSIVFQILHSQLGRPNVVCEPAFNFTFTCYSDQLLSAIESSPAKYDDSLLCFQLWRLSNGIMTVACNFDSMSQSATNHRLRPSATHCFTWIGYERLSSTQGIACAMVPHRIPSIGTKKVKLNDETTIKQEFLDSFKLKNYAMMLNIFDLPLD